MDIKSFFVKHGGKIKAVGVAIVAGVVGIIAGQMGYGDAFQGIVDALLTTPVAPTP